MRSLSKEIMKLQGFSLSVFPVHTSLSLNRFYISVPALQSSQNQLQVCFIISCFSTESLVPFLHRADLQRKFSFTEITLKKQSMQKRKGAGLAQATCPKELGQGMPEHPALRFSPGGKSHWGQAAQSLSTSRSTGKVQERENSHYSS